MSSIYNDVYIDKELFQAEEIAEERGEDILILYDENPETFQNLPENNSIYPRIILISDRPENSPKAKKVKRVYLQTQTR